jgi:hypothetical protein
MNNTEAILSVLPDRREEAKSVKEIALALGLDTSLRADRIRNEQKMARILRKLARWGWVACDQRKRPKACKHRRNTYWKTELAKSQNQLL